jgi:hypothetical protein
MLVAMKWIEDVHVIKCKIVNRRNNHDICSREDFE